MSILCGNWIAWPAVARHCSQSMLIFIPGKRSTEIPRGSCEWIGKSVWTARDDENLCVATNLSETTAWLCRCSEHIWEAGATITRALRVTYRSGQLLTTYTLVHRRPLARTTMHLTIMVSQNQVIPLFLNKHKQSSHNYVHVVRRTYTGQLTIYIQSFNS